MNWYDVTKDIIIPLLGVLATIVIGIVVAIFLRRKDEKAKIKSLLIDTYMDFLPKRQSFFAHQAKVFEYKIIHDIHENIQTYFSANEASKVSERVKRKYDQLCGELERHDLEEGNWTPFTYRFAFLLGAKKYAKKVQPLENDIVNNYMKDGATNHFFEELKNEVKKNENVKQAIILDNSKMSVGFDELEYFVASKYSEFQVKIFDPYANKVADLIDKY